mmetsp:Transcript_7353/g.9761  ORF Transcript_7353/g.9761 Transcript_7353/m.9761 type:complete len:148 (+) Transcript_7353:117-560(+)
MSPLTHSIAFQSITSSPLQRKTSTHAFPTTTTPNHIQSLLQPTIPKHQFNHAPPPLLSTTSALNPATAAAAGLSQNSLALIFMSLLSIQFAIQPMLSRKYTSQTANRRGVILVQEVIKFTLAGIFLLGTGMDATRRAISGRCFCLFL